MLISELAKDMRFEGFLLVRSAEQRVSNANGSRYLDMTLCDRSGEVNAKVWDGLAAPPASGSVIKVRALITGGEVTVTGGAGAAAIWDGFRCGLKKCAPRRKTNTM